MSPLDILPIEAERRSAHVPIPFPKLVSVSEARGFGRMVIPIALQLPDGLGAGDEDGSNGGKKTC